MDFYGNEDVKQSTSNMRMSKEDNYSVLDDPAYREKYKERFMEAQKKGMDMVVCYDGTIILIENKISMYPYSWHKKKRDFERAKLNSRDVKKGRSNRKASGEDLTVGDYSKEEEYIS